MKLATLNTSGTVEKQVVNRNILSHYKPVISPADNSWTSSFKPQAKSTALYLESSYGLPKRILSLTVPIWSQGCWVRNPKPEIIFLESTAGSIYNVNQPEFISLMDILPSFMESSPIIVDKKVDLPAPTDPTTPKNSP